MTAGNGSQRIEFDVFISVTPSDRWRMIFAQPGDSPMFPAEVGGHSQI
jgi:hypothetical protein